MLPQPGIITQVSNMCEEPTDPTLLFDKVGHDDQESSRRLHAMRTCHAVPLQHMAAKADPQEHHDLGTDGASTWQQQQQQQQHSDQTSAAKAEQQMQQPAEA
jgi:hypothetical protein